MKKLKTLLILAILVTACNVTSAENRHVSRDHVKENRTESVDVTGKTVVTAEYALWLRDRPDEEGGIAITSMPTGSEFTVYGCRDGWAVGVYVSPENKAWWGYASGKYLQDGCGGNHGTTKSD